MAEAMNAVRDQHVGHAARIAALQRGVHRGQPALAHERGRRGVQERAERMLQRARRDARDGRKRGERERIAEMRVDVVARAAQAGVAVRAVSPMFAPDTARPGLVLGFGGFDRARIEAAAQRLADVVGDAAGRDSSEESRRHTQRKVVRGQQT